MTLRNWLDLLALGAVWGGAFFFARIAVGEIHPVTLVFLRVFLGAITIGLFLALTGRPVLAAPRTMAALAGLAVLNNVIPFSLIFAGQTELGAGLASVINATTPFWTAIAASLLTADEKLTANKIAGILIGIAGAALVVGPTALQGSDGPAWAKFAILGGTLSYALAAIYARRFRSLAPPVIASGQLLASSVIMAPVMLLFGKPETLWTVSPRVWAAVLALAIVSTSFAYILYFRLIASAGATNASLVTLVIPAFALALGVAFLGESLHSYELAGLALIATGLVTIDGRLLRRRYKA